MRTLIRVADFQEEAYPGPFRSIVQSVLKYELKIVHITDSRIRPWTWSVRVRRGIR